MVLQSKTGKCCRILCQIVLIWYLLLIYIHIYIYIYIHTHIYIYGQIAQWLEHVQGKHELVGSNPTRASFLYGIEKP